MLVNFLVQIRAKDLLLESVSSCIPIIDIATRGCLLISTAMRSRKKQELLFPQLGFVKVVETKNKFGKLEQMFR